MVILGLGSIGGIFLSGLIDSGAEIVVVTRGVKFQIISNDGVIVYSPEGSIENIPPDLFTLLDSESGLIPENIRKSCDIVIICGKSNDMPVLSKLAGDLLSDYGMVMSIQNGLGNSEYLSTKFGMNRVLTSTVTHGAWHSENSFHWEGRGTIKIGNLNSSPPSVLTSNFLKLLNKSNLSAVWSENINKDIWIKLLINIGINPLCAITGLKNGAILSDSSLWDQSRASMDEASQIAYSYGVDLYDVDFDYLLKDVVLLTSNNRCSMLQDVMANRPTEIDSLCGEIVNRGENLGIPTPLNSMLLTLVKGIENSSKID